MTARIRAVLARARELGWFDAALLGTKRLVERITGGGARLIKYRLVAQPVATAPRLSGRRGRSIVVRPVTPGEISLLAAFPRPPSVLNARFHQGAECLVAFSGDEPIGFLWFTLGDYDEDEVRCRYKMAPPRATAWDFDVFVVAEHRLGPAFLRLWDAADASMTARGVRWTFSRIDAFNETSLRAHARLGARRVGWASFLVLGPVQLTVASMRPWVHLGWGRGSCPVLELDSPGFA